ncbi:MAG: hypothetical protein Hens3KO_08630 [Henriciella sp.]
MSLGDLKLFDTALAGMLLAVFLMMTIGKAVLWVAQPHTPNLMGYSELGWSHKGKQTLGGGTWTVPRWAGFDAVIATSTSMANHKTVHMQAGQIFEFEASGTFDRGEISLGLFRSNWPIYPKDHALIDSVRLDDERPSGVFRITIPEDGYYKIAIHHWPEADHSNDLAGMIPMPDYDFIYDVKWRLRRDLETR